MVSNPLKPFSMPFKLFMCSIVLYFERHFRGMETVINLVMWQNEKKREKQANT